MAELISDGSSADVQAKIDSAIDGDSVTLPEGEFTWNSTVSISGRAIKIIGTGAERVLARSVTSVAVGTGVKTFSLITEEIDSIEELKSQLVAGLVVRVYRAGGELDANAGGVGVTGNLPWMEGEVVSLFGTTLTIDVVATNYSGTHGVWIVTRKPSTSVIANVAPSSAALEISESVVGNVEIYGIHFGQDEASDSSLTYLIKVQSASSGEPVLIHDCSFTPVYGKAVQSIRHESNRGIIWNCTFNHLPASHGSQNGIYHNVAGDVTSWSRPSTMGAEDVDGKSNLYVEDCDFHFNNDVIDCSENSRLVARRCLFNNSGMGAHGPDTDNWGARHYEAYDNVFVFNQDGGTSAYNIQGFLIPRGGTGIFADNTVDDIVSFGAWGDKSEVYLQIQMLTRNAGPNPLWGSNNDTEIAGISVDNPTTINSTGHGMETGDYARITGSNSTPSINGYHQITRINDNQYTIPVNVTISGNSGKSNRVDYPAPRQIGFGYTDGSGLDGAGRNEDSIGFVGDSEPFYSWGNGGSWSGIVGVDGSDQGQATDPDLAEDYVKAGRDFFTDGTEKPDYVKFQYPHPLRTDAVGEYVENPEFTPIAGEYEGNQSIEITTATAGATIRYTTDGSDPTPENGIIYTTVIGVAEDTDIRAIAYKEGLYPSQVVLASYTITGPSEPSIFRFGRLTLDSLKLTR